MAVIFDEKPMMPTRPRKVKTSYITSLVLKTGLAKTEAGAQVVMLIITICAVALTVFFMPVLFPSVDQASLPSADRVYNTP